jgi:hypothetical protein
MRRWRFALVILGFMAMGCPRKGDPSSATPRATEEACVDRWLSEHGLDAFGSPRGTQYAGGTPLFDEASGKAVDRLAYVYGKQPQAKVRCAPPVP